MHPLYYARSAFATGGTVNCGLTIAALALRLRDKVIMDG
jgi:hypothetical protein